MDYCEGKDGGRRHCVKLYRKYRGADPLNRGGSRKKYWGGGWPLIIWEATTAKRNYYTTNYMNH